MTNIGEFPCTCRFYRAEEFGEAKLIEGTECGYHASLRRRVVPAANARDTALEAAAKLCEALEERCSAACAKWDGHEEMYWRADGGSDAADELAQAIRALKASQLPQKTPE